MSIWLTIRMTEWVNNRISKRVCTESIKNKLLKIRDYADRCVISFTHRCKGTPYHCYSKLRTSVVLGYLNTGRERTCSVFTCQNRFARDKLVEFYKILQTVNRFNQSHVRDDISNKRKLYLFILYLQIAKLFHLFQIILLKLLHSL